MTEEEAKTKWCPFVGGANARYIFEGRYTQRCIGSACMAWRWELERYEQAREAYEDSWNIGGINTREEPRLHGHCGLAGAPR